MASMLSADTKLKGAIKVFQRQSSPAQSATAAALAKPVQHHLLIGAKTQKDKDFEALLGQI